MKNLFISLLLFVISSITNDSSAQKPRNDISGDYLLKTQWGGNELYCKYSPALQTLGCHSTALAQVLYFNKLRPFGKVSYKCSKGYQINEDFSNYNIDWNKISNKLSDTTLQDVIDATVLYNYYVACVVQKDFGTSQYVDIENSNNHKSQIEQHFKCKYESYNFKTESSISDLLEKNKSIVNIIKREIEDQRPIGFYYDRPNNGGHAIVIDGYTLKENNFYVHANFGWSGSSDGWYLLPEDLPKDIRAIIILTIKPI
jgi:hypothetical protein